MYDSTAILFPTLFNLITGDSRLGITHAAIAGRPLTDMILGKKILGLMSTVINYWRLEIKS
ncbi:hypothetical protein [Dendronalium sp. ChiSLP03b]|uniref:hypothetical protein n=1 Tax=Dendronalium sp. ChiSLP03b TaxID=3075381 RepID=UPI002AD3F4EF|nr:hypothetical protein [Dendronalium sp. ChiSLP03b]MDZ8204297.1 hypothetical protein [Dendronalium sp. ChiSLP03b]